MHWIADAAGLASSGSVFPGYPDHVDEDERRGWRVAAERQWARMLEMRAIELAPGGWFIAAIPASPAACPDRTGLYIEIVADMNLLLAEWNRAGRIGDATVAAAVVPVWSRTLDEFRAPFTAGGGSLRRPRAREHRAFPPRQPLLARRSRGVRAGLCQERDRMGRTASPARLRARRRGTRGRPPRRLPRRARGARREGPRPVSLGLHRGPRHMSESDLADASASRRLIER